MTMQPLQLDPEVEGILREVAADPRSKLLRVPRKTSIRALMEQRPTVGVATAGLTVAERHLVQTYRAEVAYALVSASWYLLTEGSDSPNLFSRQGTVGIEMPVPSKSEVEASLHSAWTQAVTCSVGPGIAPPLRLLSAPSANEAAVAYCRLAQQISPTYHAQVHASAGLIGEGHYSEACQLALEVLKAPHTNRTWAIALTNLGLAESRLGRLRESYRSYSRATVLDPSYASAACSRFVVALRLGDEREAEVSGLWISKHISDDDPSAARLISHDDAHRGWMGYAIEKAKRTLLFRRHSQVVRRLAHV